MSQKELICKLKPYIQPFERRLALMELEAVTRMTPTPETSILEEPLVYRVITSQTLDHLADTLTYWEVVNSTEVSKGRYTRQIRRESTTNFVRNGVTPDQLRSRFTNGKDIPLPTRRVLRYGPHGVHEYRGKFFPQLVRSLLNIGGVNRGDIVLDPMCGSGTAPVEASLLGCQAIGVDINPLSVLMSQAKCSILRINPDLLASEYESLKTDILDAERKNVPLPWFEQLPERDRAYLKSWFSAQVLADLDLIAIRVHGTSHPACRDLFRLCLSNILRRVSWQKESDLRVRKEIRLDADIDAVNEFINELSRTVRYILAFLYEESSFEVGVSQIIEGDARIIANEDGSLAQFKEKITAVVTSPPYATALPYLDTDRLSLSYLGLLSRPEHRKRDYEMIGNREITETRRREYFLNYQRHRHVLPAEVNAVIDRIYYLNESGEVGFRRRNLASLLAHYFFDMRQVFQSIVTLLQVDAPAYVVIGNNHTIAGGQRIEIETDRLLGLIGESVGLHLEQVIPMEMLISRDIFKNNAVTSETILYFRKPG